MQQHTSINSSATAKARKHSYTKQAANVARNIQQYTQASVADAGAEAANPDAGAEAANPERERGVFPWRGTHIVTKAKLHLVTRPDRKEIIGLVESGKLILSQVVGNCGAPYLCSLM